MKTNEFYCNQLHSVINVTGIYTIHYFKYGKNFTFPEESHNFWELVFIDSGNAEIVAGKNKLNLSQGQIIFHKPNLSHTISTKNEFCNSAIISFDATGRMLNFFEDRVLSLTNYEKELLLKIIQEGKLSFKGKLNLAHQKKMEKREDAPFGTEQIIANNLELLLISLIRNNYEKHPTQNQNALASSHSQKLVNKIMEILKSRITSSVNLDDLAKELYFSKTYIKSVFKKHTQTSIIQYYNRLKIDEAKKLISEHKNSFTEIALMLGFSSVHYFTRLFKSLTDMTPSQYLKSIKADNILDD